MTSEIHPTVPEKQRVPKRPTGAPGGGGRLPRAVLIAAAVLILAAAAAPAAGKTHKTHPRDALLRDKGDSVNDLALSPDGKTVAILEFHDSRPRSAAVWDVQTKKQLATLKCDGWEGDSPMAFTADGGSLLVLGGRRVDRNTYRPSVGVWDAKTWTLSRTVDLEFDADIAGAVFTPDGKSLIVGTRSLRVGVYDLQTGKRTLDLKCDEPPDAFAPTPKPPPGIVIKSPIPYIPPAPALALSADGKTLAVGTHERFLFFIDLATGKVLQKNCVGFTVDLLAFSPDGKTLVSGGAGGARDLQVWDVATGKNIDSNRSPDHEAQLPGCRVPMMASWRR